jgi:hypothetical protein
MDPKRHSVRFNADEDEENPLFSTIYINKEAAKKVLGVSLEKVKGVEVTVRIIK